MKKILLVISILFSYTQFFAQCAANENLIEIEVVPDNYPDEITWVLKAEGVQILNGTYNNAQICVSDTACLEFIINDGFGDGICCAYGNGSYTLKVDGVVEATGGQYTTSETVHFNCAPGTYCTDAITITEGTYSAPQQNFWYSFTPTQTGMFDISTCGLSTCDTKVWVYGVCNSMVTQETNVGTLFFDDNEGGCGQQAVVHGYFQVGVEYLIRIGLATGASCAGPIDFSVTYIGPVTGCMDPNACNYNPLATISDNSCAYYPSPNCTGGPDLMIVEPEIVNSLNIRQQTATDCMVQEGCMNGYGDRTILAFDTHIKNIGDMDYFIGDPVSNPSQFTFQNCHGHAHYEGYADYILYTPNGQSIPIGHKNGFCVLDLECNDGGNAQYSCGNMGISKQCGDIYNNGLDCQWIDITDVDTGQYIMAVKVNWDQSPDALGRYETNYANNWAQACIRITQDQNGNKGYTVDTNCDPYIDCNGVAYGNSVIDCNGNCGGGAVKGDLDADSLVEVLDSKAYANGVVNQSLTLTNCNDLSADGMLSVWDAGLDLKCALGVSSNACSFPNTVQNLDQYVELGYITMNTEESYIDVYIKNPENKVLGYEFNFSGLTIGDVESLIDPIACPMEISFQNGGTRVIGLSYVDSTISKNFVKIPLIRVYYTQITGDDVCIGASAQVLNGVSQPTAVNVIEACISMTGIEERGIPNFSVKPNPASTSVVVELRSKMDEKMTLTVLDALGRKVMEKTINPMENQVEFDVTTLSNGFYNVVLANKTVKTTQKIIVKH